MIDLAQLFFIKIARSIAVLCCYIVDRIDQSNYFMDGLGT